MKLNQKERVLIKIHRKIMLDINNNCMIPKILMTKRLIINIPQIKIKSIILSHVKLLIMILIMLMMI